MKSITPDFMNHLAGTVTTVATCWRITRTDGQSFSFTSFDADLVVEGVTYISTAGFSRSAIASGSTGEVDNLEVIGYFTPSGITQQDLKNGLFNYASVSLFAVNWADLTMGICRLRYGWLGECSNAPSGGFLAELRGLTQALVQEFGNMYSPLCRADLGDNKCKIPITPPLWAANTIYAAGQYVRALTQSSDALRVAIFQANDAGTSGEAEPSWDTTIGNTSADDGFSWTSRPYYRGISSVATVTDQRTFVTAALTLPGAATVATTAGVIDFRNNVSAFTTIEVSDGVVTGSWTTQQDLRGYGDGNNLDAVHLAYNALTISGLNMTIEMRGSTLFLTNNSGHHGNIIKTGDRLGGIVISNFASAFLDAGVITWISGGNAGKSMEMKTYDTPTSTVSLWLAMDYAIQPNDRFYFYSGCDKRRDTCLQKFNNIQNFRGEPDMPGMDAVLAYPDL